MLSVTTDYATGTGSPEPYLRRIADAGFTHVHWCHQWNTDFLYDPAEIDQIAHWLRGYGLQLLDLHGSDGQEKAWGSPVEYQRLAGVALVKNRIAMAATLGSGVIIMHIPRVPIPAAGATGPAGESQTTELGVALAPICRSLDALAPFASAHGVRIAIENMGYDDFGALRWLFARYGPDFLGLCYDAGHGNLGGRGLDHLETVRDRLISIHLHDNDGSGDHHKLLFSGTVDWPRLAQIIATSAYAGGIISMEVAMRQAGIEDEAEFLREAFRTGTVFSTMVEASAPQDG
mgnify:CR=1 FL=1